MAGYRETFGGNIDYAAGRGGVIRGRGRDIAGQLQGHFGDASRFAQDAIKARKGIHDLKAELAELEGQKAMTSVISEIEEYDKKINKARKDLEGLRKQLTKMPWDAMEKSLGRVTKSLLTFNTSLLAIGFDFLIDSIKRVYELQERWTKAIGGFNLRLGGMTKGMAGATAAATRWSSTIRGLTGGDITEGIELFGEFTEAIGRTVKAGDQFEKVGIQMARGFNLGGQGAGQLLKVLQNIGDTGDDVSKLMGSTLIASANQADVPVNMLAKDILESSEYMARFGKEGQKTFVTGAAYARKFTVTMKQLQAAVQDLDMFDEAAKTASKLNTVFGTMINSMDLMMEDDPAKRMEMIRQQLLAQGKTFDTLTPKQRRYLSETMKLTEDQVASLLDAKNAGVSYADFQKKAAAKEKSELDAKKNMELMLRKTAQTMYAFGAAFDRVTVAIANAIKPLLQVLGLAKSGGKDFKSFGQVMESITVTVEEFFNSLAHNEKWNKFMVELAFDMKRAGSALRDFVMSGKAADTVGALADAMKSFYTWVRDLAIKVAPALEPLGRAFLFIAKNVDKIAVAWLALKAVNKGRGLVDNLVGMLGGGMGAAGKGGLDWGSAVGSPFGGGARGSMGGGMMAKAGGMANRAISGVGVGAAIGGITGDSGAGIGGMVGGLLGPIGAAAGAAIGWSIKHLFDYFTKNEKLEESQKDLEDAMREGAAAAKKHGAVLEVIAVKQRMEELKKERLDKLMLELQKGHVITDKEDLGIIKQRVQGLTAFGVKSDEATAIMDTLTSGGKLTKKQFDDLTRAGGVLSAKQDALSQASAKLLEQDEARMEFGKAELRAAGLKSRQATVEADLTELKAQGDELHSRLDKLGILGARSDEGRALQAQIEKKRAQIAEKEQQKVDLAYQLQRAQAKTEEKHYLLDLKRSEADYLTKSPEFVAFADQMAKSGVKDLETQMKMFLAQSGGGKGLQEYLGVDDETYKKVVGMASGGIVTRPTRALIGEAGPEAVVPLRAMARGKMRNPQSLGGSSVQNAVYGSGGGTRVVATVADVNLDGRKVGSAVVKTMITGRD